MSKVKIVDDKICCQVKVPLDWFNFMGVRIEDLDEDIVSDFLSHLVGYGGDEKGDDLREYILVDRLSNGETIRVGKYRIKEVSEGIYSLFKKENIVGSTPVETFIKDYDSLKEALEVTLEE